MFYGRQDVFSFIQRNLIGRHRDTPVVLYGQRRTGKTSVLYQLHRHLDVSYRCIFIDLHGLNLRGEENFLIGIANAVSRVLRRDYKLSVEVPDRASFSVDPRSTFEAMFLEKVWAAIGQDHLVLMMDEVVRLDEEVRAGRLEREVFDYLRHLMQHYARLNFIFSLGSGLEEMAKDYAFLFSVSLYHRISFLEPAAASELIIKPVQDHYRVAPKAVERILEITSCHPYYTQLVCHCVFELWSRAPKTLINAADINLVLPEAIELGSANLTYVWEDSTPGEQALMAGMTAAMGDGAGPATMDDVRSAWFEVGVSFPEREVTRALRSLISREVLVGGQTYRFTVDLQRLWLERHRRLDWVKDELAETVEQWNRSVERWPADMIYVRDEQPKSGIIAGSQPSQRNEADSISNAKPRISPRRYLLIISAVVLLASYLLATSVAHTFPFSSRAQNLGQMKNLIELLPGDLSQSQQGCHLTSAPRPWSAPNLVLAVHCTDPTLRGGNIYAYQLGTIVDFQAAWHDFNQWWKFSPAGAAGRCPPPGTLKGEENLSSNDIPEADRQVLECGLFALSSKDVVPAYAMSFPTNDMFLIALGMPGSSFSALAYWLTHTPVQKQSS
jgi:hypothetical protein